MASRDDSAATPLLSARAALIFLIAACSGIAVGCLTYFASKNLPEAVLAGLLAAGGVTVGCNTLIGR
jgi:hypothetical protein